MQTTRVMLLCSGLGVINRGFESFTRECFDALSQEPALDVFLFKGGGKSTPREIRLANLRRDSRSAKLIAAGTRRRPYSVEQLTFALSLLPHLSRVQPDVIYFSDEIIGLLLARWRKMSGAKFKLLLSNGGPLDPPFPQWDHIQQVTPANLENALRVGELRERQTLLPYGFRIAHDAGWLEGRARTELRQALGVPTDRHVVLSVGAVNRTRKRMDYVVESVAKLAEPRPFLVILGQSDIETPEIEAMARARLGREGYVIRNAPYEQVHDFYRVADMFALASLHEGFGRVVVEAMSHGLPCLVHDYGIMRYLLGEFGRYGDFTQPSALAVLMREALRRLPAPDRAAQREEAYRRFSWDALRPEYVKMIQRCAAS